MWSQTRVDQFICFNTRLYNGSNNQQQQQQQKINKK